MSFFLRIRERADAFFHDEKLKNKLYVIIFESDTPMGKLFDTCLIGFIITSILVVVLESIRSFSYHYTLGLRILEYVFTVFFTFEYEPFPKKMAKTTRGQTKKGNLISIVIPILFLFYSFSIPKFVVLTFFS